MELNNSNLFRLHSTFLVHFISRHFSHWEPYKLLIVIEHFRQISCQFHSHNFNSLVFEPMFFQKLLTANNCTACTIACWAALQLSQHSVNFGCVLNLFQSETFLELRVRIVETVFMILSRDLSKMLRFRSIHFHMLHSCIAEKFRSEWWISLDFHELLRF